MIKNIKFEKWDNSPVSDSEMTGFLVNTPMWLDGFIDELNEKEGTLVVYIPEHGVNHVHFEGMDADFIYRVQRELDKFVVKNR